MQNYKCLLPLNFTFSSFWSYPFSFNFVQFQWDLSCVFLTKWGWSIATIYPTLLSINLNVLGTVIHVNTAVKQVRNHIQHLLSDTHGKYCSHFTWLPAFHSIVLGVLRCAPWMSSSKEFASVWYCLHMYYSLKGLLLVSIMQSYIFWCPLIYQAVFENCSWGPRTFFCACAVQMFHEQ